MKKEIEEMIKTLENICNSKLMGTGTNNQINRTINKVRNIYADKTIKIAVLGEFSSGKSTFINALLKENILVYGDEPTTAVNTYISYGENIRTRVVFSDCKEKVIPMNKIHNYIKESNRSKECEKVIINHNNKLLKEGIVIIDTPGANVDIKFHNMQRKKAIDEASVGIFLMSIQNLTSKSFIEFLNENRKFIHKLIFIVTKCDLLKKDEIDIDMRGEDSKVKLISAYNYVEATIKKHCGVKKPIIHMISSKSYIEKGTLDFLDVENAIKRVEDSIKALAIKDKESIILGEVFRSFNGVLGEIKIFLQDRTKFCEAEMMRITEELKNFDNFIITTRRKFEDDLARGQLKLKNDIMEIVESKKSYKFESIKSKINEINSYSTFKKSAESIVISGINYYAGECRQKINPLIYQYGRLEMAEAEERFKGYFQNIEKTYEYLGINRRDNIKKILKAFSLSLLTITFGELIGNFNGNVWVCRIIFVLISIVLAIFLLFHKKKAFFVSVNSYYSTSISSSNSIDYYGKGSKDEAVGAGGGLIVGALVGGPIGAILGAGIGAIIGGIMAEGKLEKAKIDFITKIESRLEVMGVEQLNSAYKAIEVKQKSLKKGFEDYVAANIRLYGSLLSGIEKYNNSMYAKIGTSYKAYKGYFKAIEKHIKFIENHNDKA